MRCRWRAIPCGIHRRGNRVTLRELRYLVAVIEHRHFGQAAEACHVTQSTLSLQLRKLEDYLGVTLIDRTGRRPAPTFMGELIAERASRILSLADEILVLTRQRRGDLEGVFNIGVIPSLAPYYLPWMLPHLSREYPRLHLIVVEDTTRRLEEKLDEQLIDAAVVALPAFRRADLIEQPLFDEPFFVACPPSLDGDDASDGPIDASELTDLKLLLLTEGHCLRGQALAICARLGIAPEQSSDCRATSLETLRQLVSAGLGYTFLPALAANAEGASRLTVRPSASGESRRIGLVWRSGHSRRGELERLAASLQATRPAGVVSVAEPPLEHYTIEGANH